MHRMKIAFCWQLAAHPELAQYWLQQMGDANIVVAGRAVDGPTWFQLACAENARHPLVAATSFFAGQGPDRNGTHTGTVPVLTQPLWSQSLESLASQHIAQLMRAWEGQQQADTLPLGTAYTVWTGIGAIGTVVLGIWLFNEPLNAVRLGCIALILAGIIGLKATSGAAEPKPAAEEIEAQP